MSFIGKDPWPVEDARLVLGEDARAAAEALDRIASRAAGRVRPESNPVPIVSMLRTRAGSTPVPRHAKAGLPVLSGLSEASFADLVARSEHRSFEPADVIFRKGDRSDELYVITHGVIHIVDEFGESIRRLGPGDAFGEIGLFTDRPRTASAEGVTHSRALVVSRDALVEVIRGSPEVLDSLLVSLRDRLAHTAMASSPLFEHIADAKLRTSLVGRFTVLDVEPGTVLIEQGHPSPGLFIVADGRLEVAKDAEIIAVLEPFEIAGEISLVTRSPAMASVVAVEPTLIVGLPEDDYREAVVEYPALGAAASALASSRLALAEIQRKRMLQ
ncbi:MAG: cyclic nucleotide-binding domain-containing protein [Deltaproteobacteria bacterium]|nr:cyclic nucleotide-binding domain-containing protein [Deltaproteobacteria bacterium]